MDHETEAASCGERLTVRCDFCGEVYLTDNPLRPSCDECERKLREAFDVAMSFGDSITDEEAERIEMCRLMYEVEMERRASR